MTFEELDLLRTEALREAVAANCDRDPLEVALDSRVPHARVVATQVKYLARARRKLPAYAAARCILPPRAFEQASSEACAGHKGISGGSVLDLTCGLGVDARALARRFDRVVTLERDPVLAAVAAENFVRLGVGNVEVVNASAEDFLARTRAHFDWIYADPDRRSADGRKQVRLEECSPDVQALLPRIREVGDALCIKNSPLFDVDEALRRFPDSRVEVVSLDGECKEVLVYDDGTGPLVTATALTTGAGTVLSFSARPEPVTESAAEPFEPGRYRWLVEPDVALQKARLARRYLQGAADGWSDNGYGFAAEEPTARLAGRASGSDAALVPERILGRVFAVERIEPYDPKQLKRSLKGRGVQIRKRDFPLAAEEVARRLGVHAGDDVQLAFTKVAGKMWTVWLKGSMKIERGKMKKREER